MSDDPQVPSKQGPHGRKPAVLCVDDEPPVLSALKRLLRQEPYDFLTSEDPREALAWIRKRPIALLITDQRMPEMSGVDLVKAVREQSPLTPCVILTAYPDRTVILERTSLHVERLLTKPWDGEALKKTIRQLINRRSSGRRSSGKVTGMPGRGRRSGSTSCEPEDLLLRVDCRGMTASEVLLAMASLCRQAKSSRGRPVLVIDNLGLLRDSITRVLKELGRLTLEGDVRVTLVDGSGYVDAFLGAVEGAARLNLKLG